MGCLQQGIAEQGKTEAIFPKNKYIMVNLPRFNKTADEVKDPVDIWLYVLKHAHEGKPLPDFGNDIVNEALNRIKIENLDKTTLTEAEREMTTKEEMACCLAYAIRKATEDVRKEAEEAKEAAIKEAKEAAIKEAKEDAEKEVNEKVGNAKLEMVDAMLANPKLTNEDISVISGFPQDEIEKRRAQLQK